MKRSTFEVQQLILDNFDPYGRQILKWAQLARKAGIPATTMSNNLRTLRTQKRLPSGVKNASTSLPLPTLDGIIKFKGAKSREERLEILNDIANRGGDIARIQAVRLLEDLEASAGLQYGPPPPTTKEDTIVLVVELLSSMKPEWMAEAIEIYEKRFEEPTEPQNPKNEPSDSALGGRS